MSLPEISLNCKAKAVCHNVKPEFISNSEEFVQAVETSKLSPDHASIAGVDILTILGWSNGDLYGAHNTTLDLKDRS